MRNFLIERYVVAFVNLGSIFRMIFEIAAVKTPNWRAACASERSSPDTWEGDVGTFVTLCPRKGNGDYARRGVPR
jgi:hypothetical protein